MRKYEHHLYPRYMVKKGEIPPWGDPNALINVTYNQHIMFHWCNYRLWGNLEDLAAFRFMRGCKEEGHKLALELATKARLDRIKNDPKLRGRMKESAKRASKSKSARMSSDPDFKAKIVNQIKGVGKLGTQASLAPEARAKRLETFRKNNHQRGAKNSQYGTMWITDGSTNRKIKKGDPIPEGFRAGRTCK
jgi:hypothetical protein